MILFFVFSSVTDHWLALLKIAALSILLRKSDFDTGAFNHALVLILELFGTVLILLDTRAFFRSFNKLHLSSDTITSNETQDNNHTTSPSRAQFSRLVTDDALAFDSAGVACHHPLTAEEQIYVQNMIQIERFCDRWTQDQKRWVFDILIMILLLIVGGVIFSAFEGWPFNQSALFCIVSLTTIGM
jgi:hypothetical protein